MKKRYYSSGTLYFFPAFLPLVELVPWVITLLSVVVAAAGFSFPVFLKKFKRAIITLSLFCFVIIASYFYNLYNERETMYEGTRLVGSTSFPMAKLYNFHAAYTDENLSSFQVKWQKMVNSRILSSPIIQGDVLVYGSYDGSLEAVSMQNGEPAWSLPQNTYASSLATDRDGNIYAGEGLHDTEFSTLTSMNASAKSVNWQRKFSGHLEGLPVIDEVKNKLWISAGGGGLWAVDKRDAKVLLHLPLGHIDSEPLLLGGKVYVQAQENQSVNLTTLFAVNEEDGKVLWQVSQTGQPWGSPLLRGDGKAILTTTGLGQLGINKNTDKGWAYAVTTDGKVEWKTQLPNMALQPSIYIPTDNLYINTIKSGEIVALDTSSGQMKWQVKIGDGFMASATYIEGLKIPMIAATSSDGVFVILDARTGMEIVHYTVGKDSSSSPIVNGNSIFVLSAYEIVAFGGLHSLVGN